jgi:hypothetical protein
MFRLRREAPRAVHDFHAERSDPLVAGAAGKAANDATHVPHIDRDITVYVVVVVEVTLRVRAKAFPAMYNLSVAKLAKANHKQPYRYLI